MLFWLLSTNAYQQTAEIRSQQDAHEQRIMELMTKQFKLQKKSIQNVSAKTKDEVHTLMCSTKMAIQQNE